MRIFPAIDLLNGQAVRLRQGDYGQRSDYGDPLVLAQSYRDAGADYVHIVDLHAAKTGIAAEQTQRIVQTIIESTGLRVELGGGIRSPESVASWLSLGVWRCVLGTAAIQDYAFAQAMAEAHGEQVVIGLDARDGYVATGGWLTTETLLAVDVARAMKGFGFTECIHTDISRDGMLGGASIAASAELSQLSGLQVVVSGGVRDVQDISRALSYEQSGISGVIAGKSLMEGTLDLAAALRMVNQGRQAEIKGRVGT